MADEIHVHREEESGRRGGAAAAAAAYPAARAYAPAGEGWLAFTDRVRWGPVWAGFLTFFALWLWFSAIGLAVAASSARPTAPGATFDRGLAVYIGIAGLVALFIGAFIMARLAMIAGKGNGAWNGVVLWGLAFSVLFLLTSIGAGGALGSLFGSGSMPMASRPAMTPGTTGQVLNSVAAGSWTFVIFQFIALLVAAAGGAVGARPADAEVVDAS